MSLKYCPIFFSIFEVLFLFEIYFIVFFFLILIIVSISFFYLIILLFRVYKVWATYAFP